MSHQDNSLAEKSSTPDGETTSSGVLLAIGLSILAFLATTYNYWQSRHQNNNVSNIVVLDFDMIGAKLMTQGLSSNTDEVLAKTQQLGQFVDELSANGTIVINKNSVIAAPNHLDMTQLVMDKLGLPNTAKPNHSDNHQLNDLPQQPQQPKKEADGLDASLD